MNIQLGAAGTTAALHYLANIPDEMKALPNFVLYSLDPSPKPGGKPRKVPRQPSGAPARSGDPSTWGSFDEVVRALQRGRGDKTNAPFAGTGFEFDEREREDGRVIVGIDFDDCLGAEGDWLPGKERHREIAEQAARAGAYVERSQSGRGVHIIGWAKPFKGFNDAAGAGVEAYCARRYFALTGDPVPRLSMHGVAAPLAVVDDAVTASAGLAGKAVDEPWERTAGVSPATVFEGPSADISAVFAALPSYEGGELSAGVAKLQLEELEHCGRALASIPNGPFSKRDGWLDWLFACTRLAVENPEIEVEVERSFHEVSDAAGGRTDDNEAQWRSALHGTAKRLAAGQDTISVATISKMVEDHAPQIAAAMRAGATAGGAPGVTGKPTGDDGPARCRAAELEAGSGDSAGRWGRDEPRTGGAEFPAANDTLDIDEVLAPRQWLAGTDLVKGEITVLAAPGGSFKSSYAIGLAASVASGKNLLGSHVHGAPSSMLYVNAEDGLLEMKRRVKSVAIRFKLDQDALKRLRMQGVDTLGGLTLTIAGPKGAPMVNDAGFMLLEGLVGAARPALLVLDPLTSLCPVGLNDNGLMSQVARSVKELALRYACAVLIVHHLKKGGDKSDVDTVAGAAAIINHARVARMILPMTEGDAAALGVGGSILPSEYWRHFQLTDAKANLAPRGSSTRWFAAESISLGNATSDYPHGDHVQVVVPLIPQAVSAPSRFTPAELAAIEAQTVQAVRDANAHGVLFSLLSVTRGTPRRLPDEVKKFIVTANGCAYVDRDKAALAMWLVRDMLARGVLAEGVAKRLDRHIKPAIVVGPNAGNELPDASPEDDA